MRDERGRSSEAASDSVRRETSHTHKHTTRTTQRTTRQDQHHEARLWSGACVGLTLELTYGYMNKCIYTYIYIAPKRRKILWVDAIDKQIYMHV